MTVLCRSDCSSLTTLFSSQSPPGKRPAHQYSWLALLLFPPTNAHCRWTVLLAVLSSYPPWDYSGACLVSILSSWTWRPSFPASIWCWMMLWQQVYVPLLWDKRWSIFIFICCHFNSEPFSLVSLSRCLVSSLSLAQNCSLLY